MPVIKSAKKKLRRDNKKTVLNERKRDELKKLIKKAKSTPSQKTVQAVFSAADKAVKIHLIHQNKAARIKSSVSKLIKTSAPKKETEKTQNTSKLRSKKATAQVPPTS